MTLTEILYALDPAGTMCRENEVWDEYLYEATDIVSKSLDFGGDIECAIKDVFLTKFNLLLPDTTIKAIKVLYSIP